jgi:ferric-dicitrate binding protein FerR (iron transport regulator)
MHGTREIELKGEAFFDVAHNPDQPFIIHTNNSTIKALGTAFNVRSVQSEENVQVAVIDGRVSFTNKMAIDEETMQENGVVLSKGQYAYMNIKNSKFQIDDIAVKNYLAWKNGKFVFQGQTLEQVCLQLKRIYEIDFSFSDPELRSIPLTAEFKNESLDKTLSVIALSLKLEFSKSNGGVTWFINE